MEEIVRLGADREYPPAFRSQRLTRRAVSEKTSTRKFRMMESLMVIARK
jgi:hypothetical protein